MNWKNKPGMTQAVETSGGFRYYHVVAECGGCGDEQRVTDFGRLGPRPPAGWAVTGDKLLCPVCIEKVK